MKHLDTVLEQNGYPTLHKCIRSHSAGS